MIEIVFAVILAIWIISAFLVYASGSFNGFALLFSPLIVIAWFIKQRRNPFLYIALALILTVGSCAFARADTSAGYANMQRAVGGILQQNAVSRGYSLSDPRTYLTLYGWGKTAATTVAAAGVGAAVVGTSPGWGSLILAAAIGAGVTYAMNIALDGTVKWLAGTGEKPLTTTNTNSNAPNGSTDLNPALQTWASNNLATYGVSEVSKFIFGAASGGTSTTGGYCPSYPDAGPGTFYLISGVQSNGCTTYNGFFYSPTAQDLAKTDCGSGSKPTSWSKCSGTSGPQSSVTVSGQTMSDAVLSIPEASLAQPIDYNTLAMMLNSVWKSAASDPGYAGVPYSISDPITTEEVQIWAQANPSSYPTVAELTVATSGPSSYSPSTTAKPGTSVSPAVSQTSSTATNPASQSPQINLGADPNIGFVVPEAPTVDSIFSPFVNLVKPFINFQINAPVGICPTANFDVFGKQILMHQHCDLFEGLRPVIQTVMSAAFMVAAFMIFISA